MSSHCSSQVNATESKVRSDRCGKPLSVPVGCGHAPLLKKRLPDTPIIMFTMFATEAFAKIAVAAGIAEVIPKDKAASDLLPRVGSILHIPTE